jgi:hypothetical protein
MGLGMVLQDLWQRRSPPVRAVEDAALAAGTDG